MRDPFRPNPKTQLIREAQVGLSVVAIVLSLFLYVAFYRITGRGRHLPDHVRNAPIAQTVVPDNLPGNRLAKSPKRFEQRRVEATNRIASRRLENLNVSQNQLATQASPVLEFDQPDSSFEKPAPNRHPSEQTFAALPSPIKNAADSPKAFESKPKSFVVEQSENSQLVLETQKSENKRSKESLVSRLGGLVGFGSKPTSKAQPSSRNASDFHLDQKPNRPATNLVKQNPLEPNQDSNALRSTRSHAGLARLEPEASSFNRPPKLPNLDRAAKVTGSSTGDSIGESIANKESARSNDFSGIPNDLRSTKDVSEIQVADAIGRSGNDFQVQLASGSTSADSSDSNEFEMPQADLKQSQSMDSKADGLGIEPAPQFEKSGERLQRSKGLDSLRRIDSPALNDLIPSNGPQQFKALPSKLPSIKEEANVSMKAGGVHLPASKPFDTVNEETSNILETENRSTFERSETGSIETGSANRVEAVGTPSIKSPRPAKYNPTDLAKRLPRPAYSNSEWSSASGESAVPESTFQSQPATTGGNLPEEQTVSQKKNPGTYVTREGDSFWVVAQRVYDDPRFFSALYKHNSQTAPDFDRLVAGTQLATPSKAELRILFPADCPAEDSIGVRGDEADMDLSTRFYVTRQGDTLWDIASNRLGQASRYLDIYQANRVRLDAQTDPNGPLPAGVRLVLPTQ